MKGLMIKDFIYLKTQKQFLLVVAILAIPLSFSSENGALFFLPFFGSIMAISTISMDEFANGNAFLFTLPPTRKTYVKEKYFFTFLLILISTLIALILNVAIGKATLKEEGMQALYMVGIMIFFFSILIPVQLKFGSEKGRIVTFLIAAAITLGILGITSLLKQTGGADIIEHIKNLLNIILLALPVICVFLSYHISVKIIEKKEF